MPVHASSVHLVQGYQNLGWRARRTCHTPAEPIAEVPKEGAKRTHRGREREGGGKETYSKRVSRQKCPAKSQTVGFSSAPPCILVGFPSYVSTICFHSFCFIGQVMHALPCCCVAIRRVTGQYCGLPFGEWGVGRQRCIGLMYRIAPGRSSSVL